MFIPEIVLPPMPFATRDIVDHLGEIKARVATLTERERELKDTLIATGVEVAEGTLFSATVSHSERKTLDMDAVRAKLSPQFIRANTTTTPTVTVKVVARKRSA